MREMKDSGLIWLGDYQPNWEMAPLKHLVSITTGKKDVNQGHPEGVYPFFTCSMTPFLSKEFSFDCEALLVAGNGMVGFTQYYFGRFEAYQRTYVLSNFKNILPSYLKHYITEILPKYLSDKSIGSVIDFIKLGDLKSFNILLPSVAEQQKIATYLDQKVALIDNIIEKTKQSIEEYKKLKQSIITEAVTKGLNPDVKMKDSGIEWIGMIPEHWEVVPLKVDFSVTLGKMLSKEQKNKDDTYENYLKAQNIKWNFVDDTIIDKMWFSSYEKEIYLLNEGDILISEGGDSGTTSIYRNEANPCYIQNAVHRVTTKGNSINTYLYYWMNHVYHIGYVGLICNKATLTHYTKIKVMDTPFVRAPEAEQREIIMFLDYRVNEIETLISKKEKLINQYEAYKKSLIYEVVTGKKEIA